MIRDDGHGHAGRAGQAGHAVKLFTRRAKYWALELRFERRLTAKERRLLHRAFDGIAEYEVGEDGVFTSQWPSKYPDTYDRSVILDVVRRIGVLARVRAAPFGRDCSPSCPRYPCKIGGVHSCAPVFLAADWVEIDPAWFGYR